VSSRVATVEAIPVAYPLQDEAYGSARGRVGERRATLVRLTTADGVVGWGEAFGPPSAMPALVREVAPQVVGGALDRIVPWVTQSLQQQYHHGNGGLHVAAVGAIETAMWDAQGRTLCLSVARLMGGRARESVDAYASTGYVTATRDAGEFRAMLDEAVTAGFAAAKVKLGLGLREDRHRAEIAREVLGPQRRLMVDFNGNYTADVAVTVVRALGDLDIAWVEEPVPPEDLAGLARMRGAGVPVAAGEAVYTRHGFRALIVDGLVDVLQPDVCKTGGLGEARVVAHLAQTWNLRFSPHVWGTAVGQAATLQLLASVPDYPHPEIAPEPLWLELDRGVNALRDGLVDEPVRPVDGHVAIPDRPGLGIEVDEDALARWRTDR
jgi:D-galactarolactone cycloisomerase